MFWPALPLAAMAITPPDPDWSTKKAMIRDRIGQLHDVSTSLYGPSPYPQYTMTRRAGTHGAYGREWDRIKLDLESVHDKFWHVYNETLAHEMAHRQAGLLGHKTGHGDEWEQIFMRLKQGLLDGV